MKRTIRWPKLSGVIIAALYLALTLVGVGQPVYAAGAPTLSAISPTSGSTAGGDSVTLTGTNFATGYTVAIGDALATNVTVVNSTTITATTPAASVADTVDVVVTNSSGNSAKLPQSFTYTDSSLEGWYKLDGNGTDSSASGHNGTVNGATATTDRYGSASSALNFNGTGNYINMGNVDNMGTGSLTVSAWFKTTTSSAGGNVQSLVSKSLYGGQLGRYFLMMENGSVESGFDSSGTAGVLDDTPEAPYLDGRWHLATAVFDRAGSESLYVDGVLKASTDMSAAAGVNMTTTDNLYIGAYNDSTGTSPMSGMYFNGSIDDVRIYNRALSATDVNNLYVGTRLSVTSISPTSGSTAGGDSVTISGAGFVTGDTVTIGDALATNVTVVNSTTITATTPAGTAAGAADVVVTSTTGQSATLTGGFTYISPAPTITGISPTSGSMAGGDSVTITGTNFITGDTVTIGGNTATGTTVVNSTTITATTPAGTAGAADVVVTDVSSQSATLSGGFTYIEPPVINVVSPSSGNVAGGYTVSITGSNFTSGDSVTFGSTPATNVTLTTKTYAIGDTGPGGGIIFYDKGNDTGGWRYLEAAPNDISGVFTWCSGTGNNNAIGASGTAIGTGKTNTATMLANCSGGAANAATAYTGGGYSDWFLPSKDELNQLYTEKNTVGGFTTNYYWSSSEASYGLGWLQLFSNGSQGSGAKTNGYYVRPVREVASTILTATAPAAASAGAVDVTVTDTGGHSTTLAGGFTYTNPAPTISSISPTSGTTAGGDSVTVTGTNFTSGDTVTIGGNAATGVAVANSTTITATTPAGTAGAADVVVTDVSSQSATLSGGFTYTSPAPTVSSFTPTVGKMQGGTTVTFSGSGFTSNMTASFGGVAGTTVSATSTSLTVTTPAGSLGDVAVTISAPNTQTATASSTYRYTPDAYAFTTTPLTLHATQPGFMTVEARDKNGNAVTAPYDITLSLTSSSGGGSFSADGSSWGMTTTTIPAGLSSVSFYYKDADTGTPSVTVTGPASVSVSQTETITSRYSLLVTGVSDPIDAGVPSSVTVQATDWQGNAVNDYTGTVHFTSDDTYASLPTDFTFTSAMQGHHTFVNGVTMVTTGDHCVTATDTSDSDVTGSQCNITVNNGYSGTISKLAIITDPQSTENGVVTSAITVETQDSSGNAVAVPVDTTIYVSSSASSGSFSADGTSGWSSTQPFTITIKANTASANVYYKDTVNGTKTLSFRDQASTTDTGYTDASQSVYIGAGPPAALSISAASSAMYGSWVPITVNLKDSSGTLATNSGSALPIYFTSDNANLQFSASSSGTNPATSFSANVPVGGDHVTVYAATSSVQTATITASDASPPDGATGLSDDSHTMSFVAPSPTQLTVSTSASTAANTPVAVTLTTLDSSNQPAAVSTDTTITLSDSSYGGSFSLSNATWSPVSSVVLPANQSSVTIYYKAASAGSVTLQASGNSMTGTTSLTITPGSYSQLVFTAGLASVPVSEAASYTVTTQDAYGNVTTVGSNTAVYLYTTSGSGSFATNSSGPWTVTSVTIPSGGSSASFYYQDTTLGQNATLTASDQTPLDNPDTGIVNATQSVTVVGQTPTSLVFTTAGQNVTAGASSNVMTIEAEKADGSPAVLGSNLTVSLTSDSTGSYGFTATQDTSATTITTVTIPAGSSTASFYYHDSLAGTHTLQAIGGGLNAAQNISITVGLASRLSFVTAAQNGETNQPSQQIEIATTDSYGNATTVSVDTTVDLASSCADSSFSLSSSPWSPVSQLTIPSGSGSAYFYFKTSASSCNITVSASGLTSASQTFTASTGPSKLSFSGAPATLDAGQSATLQVSLEDTSGNVVTALSPTTVYLFTSAGTLGQNSVTIAAGNSSASFTFTAQSSTGTDQLQARDESNTTDPDTGLVDTSTDISVVTGAPGALSVSPASGNATVNASKQLTVTLQNPYGVTTVAGSDTTVSLSSDGSGSFTASSNTSDPAITNVTIPAGSSTATVYYSQTTTGTVTLTMSASGLTAGTSQLSFMNGSIASYQYVAAPTTAEIGQTSTFSVQALDTYGNVVTMQPGRYIYLNTSSGSGTFGGNGYSGGQHALIVPSATTVASFIYRDTTVGSDTITASDSYPPDDPDTGIANAVSTIAITAGVPAQLTFTTPSNSFERGGTSNQMDVTVENAYGIVTPVSSDTTLRLTTTSPTGQFANYNTGPWGITTVTIPANTATASFYYRDNTNIGQYTLTVSSDTLTQASQSVTVQGGAPASLTFITPPQTLYATHTSPTITLGVNNRYGYPTVMDTSQLTSFSSTSSTAQFANSLPNWGSTSQTWPAGQAHITIYYRDSTPGTATLNAQVNGLGTTSQAATVLQQVFDHFLVTNISDPQVAGTSSSAVVIAQDTDDYTVAGYNGTIRFTSSDPTAVLPANYTFQPYIDKGLHTFVNGFIFSTPGEQTVTATDTATGQSGSQEAITVTSPTSPGGTTTNPGDSSTPTPGDNSGTPTPGENTSPTPGQGGDNGGSTGNGGSGSKPSSSSTGSTTNKSAPTGAADSAVHALGRLGKRIISSPAAPYVLPGSFYVLIAAFATLLLWDMYREIRTADILLAVLKRERQTTEDKMQFLNLVAHHVRTPITIIAGGAELAESLLAGDRTVTALNTTAQRLQATANKLIRSITSRVTGADGAEMPARVTLERKLYLSPLFWLPIVISLALTWLVNWLATSVGHQDVHATTIALQLLVAAMVAVLLYSALRGRNLRRRLKEALQQSLTHRLQLDDGKNAFIRSAGKELQRYVEELKPLDADLQQKQPAGAQPLHNGIQQLQKLVDTLNTLSSIDTSHIRTDQFELASVLDQALLAHNDQLAAKQINVTTSSSVHESLTQDQHLLGRVTDTLLDNAIAFSPEGGKIHVNTSETDDSTILTIADNGPGLPKAVTEQLLQPFTHPEDTFHETHQGLGLSLYLNSLIMRHLGGSLRANSSSKGTTITLTIPKAVPTL